MKKNDIWELKTLLEMQIEDEDKDKFINELTKIVNLPKKESIEFTTLLLEKQFKEDLFGLYNNIHILLQYCTRQKINDSKILNYILRLTCFELIKSRQNSDKINQKWLVAKQSGLSTQLEALKIELSDQIEAFEKVERIKKNFDSFAAISPSPKSRAVIYTICINVFLLTCAYTYYVNNSDKNTQDNEQLKRNMFFTMQWMIALINIPIIFSKFAGLLFYNNTNPTKQIAAANKYIPISNKKN